MGRPAPSCSAGSRAGCRPMRRARCSWSPAAPQRPLEDMLAHADREHARDGRRRDPPAALVGPERDGAAGRDRLALGRPDPVRQPRLRAPVRLRRTARSTTTTCPSSAPRPPRSPGDRARTIAREIATVGVWNGDTEGVRADGSTFPCIVSLSEINGDDPEERVWIAVFVAGHRRPPRRPSRGSGSDSTLPGPWCCRPSATPEPSRRDDRRRTACRPADVLAPLRGPRHAHPRLRDRHRDHRRRGAGHRRHRRARAVGARSSRSAGADGARGRRRRARPGVGDRLLRVVLVDGRADPRRSRPRPPGPRRADRPAHTDRRGRRCGSGRSCCRRSRSAWAS